MSWFDISDAEGVELDGDRDEECPFDDESTVVSEPDPRTLAAMSGEGGIVETKNWTEKPEAKSEDDLFTMPLGGMTVLELVSARDRVVAELKRRAPELEKELEMVQGALSGKPRRATRKDAGMKREEYKAQKGAA